MVTYAHTRLAQALATAKRAPDSPGQLERWLSGAHHLDLLRYDAQRDELILAALSGGYVCVNSYVAPRNLLESRDDILALYDWSPNPFHHTAVPYSWVYEGEQVRAERRSEQEGRELPVGVSPLVFFREPEGLGNGDDYSREVAQDFVHAAGIHWRRERNAYSRLDFRGDWSDIISLSASDNAAGIDLISAQRDWIDLHLVALDAVLVRVFYVVLERGSLPDDFEYRDHVVREVTGDVTFQYREHSGEGNFNLIEGVQIICPQLSESQVRQLVTDGRVTDPSESVPVEFTVLDLRNDRVTRVSTDLGTTTNYSQAHLNSLPYDISPAFFRPDVLARYRANSEKYTVRNNWISCRALWNLDYSVNDAGQIGVFICDLRAMPHDEQRYWATFNKAPEAGLSERTIQTDILGQWPEDTTPRERLIFTLQRWVKSNVVWWTWRDEGEPALLVVPRMENRDEWADAIQALSNGVVEGFVMKELRRALRDDGEIVDRSWRSIALLERILAKRGVELPSKKLGFLREVNDGRIVSGVHATGAKKQELASTVLDRHGTYAAHYEHLCEGLARELALIEQALGGEMLIGSLEDAAP